MKNSKFTEIVKGSIIIGENYTRQQRIHIRLRKKNAEIVRQAESWRHQFRLDNPPLLIRMNEDREGIPGGIPVKLPHEYSTALIRVRASVPVGDFKVVPEVVVSEDEL